MGSSLDGFIAHPNGNLDWLTVLPNPDQVDPEFRPAIPDTFALMGDIAAKIGEIRLRQPKNI